MKMWKKAVLILILLLLGAVYALQKWPVALYDTTVDTSRTLPELSGEDEVTMDFYSRHRSLCGLRIRLALMGKETFGSYHYSLLDAESGKVVAEGDIDPDATNYKGDLKIRFSKVKDSKGKQYRFVLSADHVAPEKSLSLYLSEPLKDAGKVYLNGEEQEGALMLKCVEQYLDIETWLVAFGLLLYLLGFIWFMGKLFR